jgi:L-amino acid N-acyltransferase YncA
MSFYLLDRNNKEIKMTFRNIKQTELKEITALYRSLIETEFCTLNEFYPGDIELKMDFEN